MNGGTEDFEDFVRARWQELHRVAAITVGGPDAGSHVTAGALAGLADRWAELTSTGSPTAAARIAVMTGALTAASKTPPPGGMKTPAAVAGHQHDADPGAAARVALTVVLSEAPATARAALAAARWWDETPALIADCAHTDTATVEAELADLQRALTQAHATAVDSLPHERTPPLTDALADTLEHAADTASVTDPVACVITARGNARRRRTRRAALGAGVVLTAAAVTALGWLGTPTGEAPALTPDVGQWAVVTSWSPRGALADDPAVTSIAAEHGAEPGANLLFAGTVGDTIAMVMTATENRATYPAFGFGPDQPRLRLWTAPASDGPAALVPTQIVGDNTARTPDVVALSIDQQAAAAAPAILVMTRPTIPSATITVGALPQPDGSTRPVVRELPLTEGIGSYTAFLPRLAVSYYQGPPAGVGPDRSSFPGHGPATELAAAQRTLLAAVTGHAADTLRTPTALESVVSVPGIEPDRTGDDRAPVQVTVVTTITRDGGWVRTTRLSSTAPDFAPAYLERLAAVPSSDHTHALLPVPAVAPTFIALGPDAATAVLVTTEGQVRDTATISNGLAVLTSTQDPPATTFRLRLLAPDGHTVYDAIPPISDELLD
ncbi:hypothetical protein ACOCJ4_08380 [Knoellia sp. CPCC 206435]|uniref:hypothetical protein n=1 Tax=Knoellia terrae TaxID=3404797 RepID=UPI003B42D7D9